MLREIATLYGGRPSTLATFRLARMVIGHLAVTGGLALSDSVIQHVVGKGLIGRLSARFGEGAVNGILTARIGLAALDVCRPIPQEAEAKETLTSLVRELSISQREQHNAAPRLDLALRRSHDVRNALHTAILIGGSAILLALIAWTVSAGLAWSGPRISAPSVCGRWAACRPRWCSVSTRRVRFRRMNCRMFTASYANLRAAPNCPRSAALLCAEQDPQCLRGRHAAGFRPLQ